MSVLQLGHLAALLSEPLVNGFTTGAAVHVLVSQLKDLFGIRITNYKGAFKIIFVRTENVKFLWHNEGQYFFYYLQTVIDCIKGIPRSNPYTVGISLTIIVFMVIMNEIVKPRTAKLFKFPVPAELIAVVGGTAASFLLDFEKNYKVHLVGASMFCLWNHLIIISLKKSLYCTVPIGLPPPTMPSTNLLWLVAVDAIAISIVSYSVTISMAMIFAKKQSYEVKANQEMLALVSSFCFKCVSRCDLTLLFV